MKQPSSAGIIITGPAAPSAGLFLKQSYRSMDPKLKRRANLLYRLRRHGITASIKDRIIFIPYGDNPWRFLQVRRLNQEYYFNIQFIIT